MAAVVLFLALGFLPAQTVEPEVPEQSACHVYIDEQHIWTLEIIPDANGVLTPILNIINFTRSEAELRPAEIHIADAMGEEARVERFSIDTGVPGDPYLTPFLKVLRTSFIGMDLMGDFEGFSAPARVFVDLGPHRFQLQPLDCMEFEMLAEKINQVNFNSPNVAEDFWVLKIEPFGDRQRRPRDP